jgi:HYR domain
MRSEWVAFVVGLTLVAATAAAPAASGPQLVAGSLDFEASFGLVTDPAPCPAGVSPAMTECRARIGSGFVRGLGIVSMSYFWPLGLGPPTCPTEFAKLLATTGRLIVAGKGEITFTIAEGARCLWFPAGPGPYYGPLPSETGTQPRNEPQEFTITGGTGPFAAASGTGKLGQRWFNWARVPDVGGETWTGTLEVPGLAFDVTPPTLSGATAKTFRAPKERAKRVRVTFKVTATDDVDGAVPVLCVPGSGSRVPVGRWTVRCEATDSSDNTGKAAFALIVKPRQ